MGLIKWLPLILFFSCIDMLTQTTPYNSLYFTGGSWIEFPGIETMKMHSTTNDFTLQFLVSGGEMGSQEAPALFSIVDSEKRIKLTLLRDMGGENSITTIVNGDIYSMIDDELDWTDSDNFSLISFVFSDTAPLKVYVNDNKQTLSNTGSIIVGNSNLMLGAVANWNYTRLENYWYGYVDEMRLWNTQLADSTIQFQAKHPDKFGEYYRYTDGDGIEIDTYLDSLIGIWRFNLSDLTATIIDESGNGNDGTIYTYDGNYSIELSEKGAQ